MAVVHLNVWRQQRSVLSGTLPGSAYAVVNVGGLSFTHLCGTGGEFLIDITDIVRSLQSVDLLGTVINVDFYDSNNVVMQSDLYRLHVLGNIDPERQVIPANESVSRLCDRFRVEVDGVILPPSVILPSLFGTMSVFEAFDTGRIGQLSANIIVEAGGMQNTYTNPVVVVLDGGDLFEIRDIEAPLLFRFIGFDNSNPDDRTRPYVSDTGRVVRMQHEANPVPFFKRFCSRNNTYHAEYVTYKRAWSFTITIMDSIGGDVSFTILAPYDLCDYCMYRVSFDFMLDGEKAHVMNFTAVKINRFPIYSTIVRNLDCTRRYACVQWIGRTGIRKRATFEVLGVTEEQDGAIEMLDVHNAYDVRMGLVQSLTLSLDGLNAYDYWYYSDIVTSPDVRVALRAADYDADNDTLRDSARVAVETKKVRQRDGNGGIFSTLNIEVKYRRYDRI